MEGLNQKKRKEMEGESNFRAWDDLVPELLGLIFKNLEFKVLLQVIPRVCKPWYAAVEGPDCWQRIDIDQWSLNNAYSPEKVARMLRMLLMRSSGSLRELNVSCINDDHLLLIAEHHAVGSLETLTLRRSSITDDIVEQVAPKLSSLTSLDISYCERISARSLSAIGTNCKTLLSLTWNMHYHFSDELFPDPPPQSHADEGRAIARTMPKLKHLSVAYINIDTGVALEILSCCSDLEFLNVKGCWGVHFDENLFDEKYPKVKVVSVYDKDSGSDSDWNDAWDPPWLYDPYLTETSSPGYHELAIEYYDYAGF